MRDSITSTTHYMDRQSSPLDEKEEIKKRIFARLNKRVQAEMLGISPEDSKISISRLSNVNKEGQRKEYGYHANVSSSKMGDVTSPYTYADVPRTTRISEHGDYQKAVIPDTLSPTLKRRAPHESTGSTSFRNPQNAREEYIQKLKKRIADMKDSQSYQAASGESDRPKSMSKSRRDDFGQTERYEKVYPANKREQSFDDDIDQGPPPLSKLPSSPSQAQARAKAVLQRYSNNGKQTTPSKTKSRIASPLDDSESEEEDRRVLPRIHAKTPAPNQTEPVVQKESHPPKTRRKDVHSTETKKPTSHPPPQPPEPRISEKKPTDPTSPPLKPAREKKRTALSPSNGAGPGPEEFPSQNVKLVSCRVCERTFHPDRIEKHEQACEKLAGRDTRVKAFDPVKMRVQGTEFEKYATKGKGKKSGASSKKKEEGDTAKSKAKGNDDSNEEIPAWKKKSEALRQAMAEARKLQQHLAQGGKASDLPLPAPIENTGRQCPHCQRKFNEAAFERHVPICSKLKHGPPKRPHGR